MKANSLILSRKTLSDFQFYLQSSVFSGKVQLHPRFLPDNLPVFLCALLLNNDPIFWINLEEPLQFIAVHGNLFAFFHIAASAEIPVINLLHIIFPVFFRPVQDILSQGPGFFCKRLQVMDKVQFFPIRMRSVIFDISCQFKNILYHIFLVPAYPEGYLCMIPFQLQMRLQFHSSFHVFLSDMPLLLPAQGLQQLSGLPVRGPLPGSFGFLCSISSRRQHRRSFFSRIQHIFAEKFLPPTVVLIFQKNRYTVFADPIILPVSGTLTLDFHDFFGFCIIDAGHKIAVAVAPLHCGLQQIQIILPSYGKLFYHPSGAVYLFSSFIKTAACHLFYLLFCDHFI